MADSRYVLHHEILGTGTTDPGWSKEFATLEEAQRNADQEWWTADARAVRQTITNSRTGQQLVRRQDATWIAVPKKTHIRA